MACIRLLRAIPVWNSTPYKCSTQGEKAAFLADYHWIGPHGIGRFARALRDRLPALHPLLPCWPLLASARPAAPHTRACLPSPLRVGLALRPRRLWEGLWRGGEGGLPGRLAARPR